VGLLKTERRLAGLGGRDLEAPTRNVTDPQRSHELQAGQPCYVGRRTSTPSRGFDEHDQAGNSLDRQAAAGFAMAPGTPVGNRPTRSLHRLRALDYDHASGCRNCAARICAPGNSWNDWLNNRRATSHSLLHLLCRCYLAQSSCGVRKGALLRPRPAPGQPFPSADVGADPLSDGDPVVSDPNL